MSVNSARATGIVHLEITSQICAGAHSHTDTHARTPTHTHRPASSVDGIGEGVEEEDTRQSTACLQAGPGFVLSQMLLRCQVDGKFVLHVLASQDSLDQLC